MFHVYRLPGEFHNWGLAIPLEEMREKISETGIVLTGPLSSDDSRAASFTKHWIAVQKAARVIDWDGTFMFEPHCFTVACFWGMAYGFVWRQKKFNITFLASPVKLAYLDNDVDYDAQTDTEVTFRAKQAMTGVDPTVRHQPPNRGLNSTGWATSRNGHQWRKINYVACTVFKTPRGGYGGVLASEKDGRKLFTKKFNTEQEGMDYIDEKFEEIWEVEG